MNASEEFLGQRDDDARRASHVAESVLVLVLGHLADEFGAVGAHEKLGFHKVAKYMHIPGVLELCANTGLYINKAAWAKLPASYQTMLRAACTYALVEMLAGYDARNAKAEQFKRVLESWRAFRSEQHRWFSIADARTEMSVYALTATSQ